MHINIEMQGELFTWNVTKFISQFIHFYRRVLVRLFSHLLCRVPVSHRSTHTRITSHRIAQHTTQIIKQSDLCGALYHIGRISLAL